MTNEQKLDKAKNLLIGPLKKFMPKLQLAVLGDLLRGEERYHFADMLIALAERIEKMPVSYQTDGQGDNAIVHLHYFVGGNDWWITEKDMDGEVDQAFGLASLNGYAELGYISIRELAESAFGIELDLHWTPKTLKEVRKC